MTRLLALGVQPELICRLTGHRSIAMIEHYNNPDFDQFADAMGVLNVALKGQEDHQESSSINDI